MIRFFIITALGLVLLWIGGFCYFIANLLDETPYPAQKTDGIVVLTGGKNRLKPAVQLLEEGLAGRLFISGVNEKVTREELLAVLGSPSELAACCIESESRAQNTLGNAEETALWVGRNKLSSLRVVTSREHMPRALVELKRFMPDIILLPHPAARKAGNEVGVMALAREYSKYLISLLRTRLLQVMVDEEENP